MAHQPIHSDPSYTRDYSGPADPAVVNQPDTISARIHLYADWVLCQALQEIDWTFGAPTPDLMAKWLLSNPIWKAERESYSPRTKEQILKGVMQVLVDYQRGAVGGKTAASTKTASPELASTVYSLGHSPEALHLLGHFAHNFMSEGCWVFAEALHKNLPGSSLVVFRSDSGQVVHVALRYQGDIYDADGAFTQAQMIQRLRKGVGGMVSMTPGAPADVEGVPFDATVADKLSTTFAPVIEGIIDSKETQDGQQPGTDPKDLQREAVGAIPFHEGPSDGPGDDQPSWAFQSRSGRDGGDVRVLGVAVKQTWALSPATKKHLAAVGVASPDLHELEPGEVSGEVFAKAVMAAKAANPYGASVSAFDPAEHPGARLFLSADGLAGIALTAEGDRCGAFVHPKGPKGAMATMFSLAASQGGMTGDCFDTVLPDYYSRHGARIVARLAWDDRYAPEGWDKARFAKFNNGEPDVVFTVFDKDNAQLYRAGDGVRVSSYEEGKRIQAQAVKEILARRKQASIKRKMSDEKVKSHRKFRGISVEIEFPMGSTRSGVAPDGTRWERTMVHDYGHFRGIPAVDGDSLDCYLGPDESSDLVLIIPQLRDGGAFDEYKIILGFPTAHDALQGYLAHMPDGWTNFGPLQVTDLAAFRRDWVQTPSYLQRRVASESPRSLWATLLASDDLLKSLVAGEIPHPVTLSSCPTGLKAGHVTLQLPAKGVRGVVAVEDRSRGPLVREGLQGLRAQTGLPSVQHQWAAILSPADADLAQDVLTYLQNSDVPGVASVEEFPQAAWGLAKDYNAQMPDEDHRIPGLRSAVLQQAEDYLDTMTFPEVSWISANPVQIPEGTEVTVPVEGPWEDRAALAAAHKSFVDGNSVVQDALGESPEESSISALQRASGILERLKGQPSIHSVLRPLPRPEGGMRTAAAAWDTPAFKAWFAGSKVVNQDGSPKVVCHGTTHAFDRFDPSKGDPEGFYGAALYFTDGTEDVNRNYGTTAGPDLRNRIDRRVDEIVQAQEDAYQERDEEVPDDLEDQAREQAQKELQGEHGGTVYLTYLRMINPVVVQPSRGTYFAYGRSVNRVYAAVRKALAFFDVWHADDVLGEIFEKLDTEEFTAYQLEKAVRGYVDLTDVPGGPGPFMAKVYQLLGFDGVIMDAHAQFGKYMNLGPGTHHYIVWKPTQVKSALSNVGTFSRRSPRLVASVNPAIHETPEGVRVSLGASEVEAQVIPERSQAVVRALWVAPEMRSKGIGKLLMLALAGWCKDHEIRFLTGQDVSEHGESARIRQHLPGKSVLFRRREQEGDPGGETSFQDVPEGLGPILKGLTPDEGGKILVTRLAKHLRASIYDNYCPICGQAGCGGRCVEFRKRASLEFKHLPPDQRALLNFVVDAYGADLMDMDPNTLQVGLEAHADDPEVGDVTDEALVGLHESLGGHPADAAFMDMARQLYIKRHGTPVGNHLNASGAKFNAELKVTPGKTEHLASAETDGEIGSGDYATTTDASGKFWGDAGAGCVVHSKSTGRILLSYRSEFVNEPHCWGVWGGAIDNDEAPQVAAEREVREETGYHGPLQLREAYVYTNGDFRYTTFIAEVPEEFVPKLNWEAEGYEWFRLEDLPDNLHFGLKEALPAIKSKLGETVKTKSASTQTLAWAIAKVYRSDALYEVLGEVGPFDGGCLICAEALLLQEGQGSLVYIAGPDGRPEHYGALIDGSYWDFAGPAGSPQAWIDRFITQEHLDPEGLQVLEGLGAPGEIPQDPNRSRAVADLLAHAMGVKTAASSWVIPPRLLPHVQVHGGLDAASTWTTKVWLGNSGTRDHTEVSLVAFDPSTSTIVPIAASDEHRNGWELINYLEGKRVIPHLEWHIIDLRLNFVDTRDPQEAQATVALFRSWRRLGGPNTTVRSRYTQPGFLLSMDDFIAAGGAPADHQNLGTLAPTGVTLIKALESLSAAYTRIHQGQRVPTKALARAGQATLTAFKHVQNAYILSYAGVQQATSALNTLEEGTDTQAFERAIFGFDGLKNQVHNALREYGQNQFKDRDLEDTFGNCQLALEEFNRLGSANPGKRASEPEAIDLPEIKWVMPTDAELLNEIKTEYPLEKLFIWETWPKEEDYLQAVQELKRIAKPEQLDPMALDGRHLWRSYADLKATVTRFGGPKDPDSMVEAINAGRPLPMPIVLRHANGQMEVAGGNTRSGIAALAGQPIAALVVDEAKASQQLARELIKDTRERYAECSGLCAAVEAYYLHNGPRPDIAPDQGFDAYTLSATYVMIARLLGIDGEAKEIRLRPNLNKALGVKSSLIRSSSKIASTWRKAAEDQGLSGPALEEFYSIASKAMQGGDVKTFNAFLAKLQAGLGGRFQSFLQSVGGYTGLRPVWDAVVEHDEDDLVQSLEDLRISPRLPSAKENPGGKTREVPLEDPYGSDRLQPDLATMAKDPSALEFNVNLMLQYPEFRGILGGSPAEKAEKIIDHMVDNLLWLYNHWHSDHRARSKAWYVGGNRIVHRWAERFGIRPEAVAGVMAALSPQQHWFQNVTLAERILSALCEHADEPWDDKMTQVVLSRDWGSSGKAVQDPEDDEGDEEGEDESKGLVKAIPKSILPNLEGKTLNDLDDGTPNGLYLMAVWIRAYDEAHNPNGCRNVSPEGEFGDWYRKANGEPVANRWQSFGATMKAIQIFKNPEVRNISELIGANHKVRSFYNNLIAPLSAGGDVTIDTHAVAAALLRPLSAASLPVAHNFGSGKPAVKPVRYRPAGVDRRGKPIKERKAVPGSAAIPGPTSSNVTGITGLYGFYAEAYRRAAAQVGVQPREIQSITWEAARGLFKPAQKRNKEFLTNADTLWENYSAGTTDKQTTQDSLLDLAGGIDTPEWAVANPRNAEGERNTSYSGELPSAVSSGSGSKAPARPRTRTRTPGRAASWMGQAVRAALFQRQTLGGL